MADALQRPALATAAARLAADVARGLASSLPLHLALPYEIDGFGNRLYMDDANVPSLLSLPYLGCMPVRDSRYQATRASVLSPDNPFFQAGRAARGIGSAHTGTRMVWPIALIMQALTSTDDNEILGCLAQLRDSHAGTGLMHEAFDPDDPQRFTRPWFAWANSLFGELILWLDATRPDLLQRVPVLARA